MKKRSGIAPLIAIGGILLALSVDREKYRRNWLVLYLF